MKNIHLLPTPNPSKLYYQEGKLRLGDLTTAPKNLGLSNQHIYITSDEHPKPNDFYFDFENQKVKKCETGYYNKGSKKIILTTDQDLIKDGVQSIPDEFLEWFVKNPSREEVKVEKKQYDPVFDFDFNENDLNYDGNTCYYPYKVIIPKEEHKQECKGSFKDCFNSLDKCVCDIMKQETLEEAAERIYPLQKNSLVANNIKMICRTAWVKGAK